MKLFNDPIIYVSTVYEQCRTLEKGIYTLNTERRSFYRCGCGSYADGSAPCYKPVTKIINYGVNVGSVYACDEHARIKQDNE